ncbi:hypothetical protein B0H10DRAFT_2221702 [Mycena sp. CBHHK59/15]|nr:hypothetical protein B0H10DRAFT_2221702 [Mycena sp. CBHHK59/15]
MSHPSQLPAPSTARSRAATSNSVQGKENTQSRDIGPHHQGHGAAHGGVTGTDKYLSTKAPQKSHAARNNNEDDYAGGKDDDYSPDHSDDNHQPEDDPDDNDNDKESPVHGRVRQASFKQAQHIKEQEAKEARKAAKAIKATKTAKKKALEEAGLEDDEIPEPRPDDYFTSRTLPSCPTATKVLAQRNSKVPPPPKFPSANWRETSSSIGVPSTCHQRAMLAAQAQYASEDAVPLLRHAVLPALRLWPWTLSEPTIRPQRQWYQHVSFAKPPLITGSWKQVRTVAFG